jgi:hypothetical protein
VPETPDTFAGAAEPAGAADPAEPAPGPPDAPRRRRTNHLRTLVGRLSPVGPPAGRWFAGVVAAVVTAVSTAWLLSGLLLDPARRHRKLPAAVTRRTSGRRSAVSSTHLVQGTPGSAGTMIRAG